MMTLISNPITPASTTLPALQMRILRSSRPNFDISVVTLSADGSAATGDHWNGSRYEPFIWTAATGVRPLGSPSDAATAAHVRSISPDGSAVEGYFIEQDDSIRAGTDCIYGFRWTELHGFERLAAIPADPETKRISAASEPAALLRDLSPRVRVNAASADGATIVGDAVMPACAMAMFWRSECGLQLVSDAACSGPDGAAYAGWYFWSASSVSADGRVIAGCGQDDLGGYFGYILELK